MRLPDNISGIGSQAANASHQIRLAWADLKESLELSWFWAALGWRDILQRYRGSMLGPFWLTMTTGAFIAGLGPLYARLFALDVAQYLPFMALGMTIWNFITSAINESCNAFIEAGYLMKQMKLPRLAIFLQVFWRNIIAFLHNLPIIIVIFIWFDIEPGIGALAAIPGFLVLCLNLAWIGLLFAMLCARYRDITQIVNSVLQMAFFVTPIMWNPKLQNVKTFIVDYNPFAAFIELVRAPLLGDAISGSLLILALLCLPIGYLITTWVFIRYRQQIVYWV